MLEPSDPGSSPTNLRSTRRNRKSSLSLVHDPGQWDELVRNVSAGLRNAPLRSEPLVPDRSWRGLLAVSAASACGWYFLKLSIRDNFLRAVPPRRQHAIESNMLQVAHSAMWLGIIFRKVRAGGMLDPDGLRLPFVASLGFMLREVVSLWPTALSNPLMLVHQAATFVGLAAVARSDSVAFALPTVMTTEVPIFFAALLRLLASVRGPPIILRASRLLWVFSWFATKLVVLPAFLVQNGQQPEFHQPTMLWGKVAYLIRAAISASFVVSAMQDLPAFLARGRSSVPRDPLIGTAVRRAGSTVVGSSLFAAFMSLYFVGPVAVPLIVGGALRGSRVQRFIALGAAACLIGDVTLPQPTHPNRLLWKLAAFLLQPINGYFQFQAVHSKPQPKGKYGRRLVGTRDSILPAERAFHSEGRYLLALYPHGFFPVGLMLLIGKLHEAGLHPSVVGASVLSTLPILGRLASLGGYVPATQRNIKACLQRSHPENITIIVPGGIGEMFLVRPDCEVILADRRGFVRMAVDSGAELVPCYAFGNTRIYEVATGAVAIAFERISRMLRTSILPFSGVAGTLVPFAHPQAVAIGQPIPTAGRDVEEVAQEYFAELRRLYETHRGLVGWRERELYFDGEQPPVPSKVAEKTSSNLLFPELSRL